MAAPQKDLPAKFVELAERTGSTVRTYADVTAATGMAKSAVADFVEDRRSPTAATWRKMAGAFKTTVPELREVRDGLYPGRPFELPDGADLLTADQRAAVRAVIDQMVRLQRKVALNEVADEREAPQAPPVRNLAERVGNPGDLRQSDHALVQARRRGRKGSDPAGLGDEEG